MENGIKSKLSFINYEVKKVELEKNPDFKNDGNPININFSINHKTEINNDKMQIELTVKIFDNAKENNFPFYMEVILTGEFVVEGENIELFEINGIALLYPYIRAIISTYTANSNMPTLVLPPINVADYYNKQKQK